MTTSTSGTRTAYAYARGLLGVSVMLSLGCNAAHAYLTSGSAPLWLTMGVGSIPPLILALSVEAVVFCSRYARWAWGWAAVLFAATAGLVTGFSMSFAAISDLGRIARMSWWTAPMLPVGIDALVITGLGMVALFRPRHLGEVAMERDAPRVPQRLRRAVDRVLRRDAAASKRHVDAALLRDELPTTQPVDVPELRDAEPAPTVTHTVANRDAKPKQRETRAATQPDALRDAATVEIPVTRDDSRDAAAKQGTEPSTTRRLAAVPTPRPAATHAPASPATQTATDRDADDDAEYLRRATQLVEAGRTKAPVEVVVRVLRGKDRGASNRDVADETGLTESQVQRIVKAARELDAAEEPEPEPAFA
ncbi:hypothetical protein [Mycobacterium avium]